MRLLGQFQAAGDITRIISQKYADGILLLRDLPLKVRNLRGGGVHQLLGLPDVQQRADSVLLQSLRELQRFVARVESAFRDLQLEIELAQLEIGGCQIRNKSRSYFFLSPLIGEQSCPRSLGGAAILSPKIEVIGGGCSQLPLSELVRRNRTELGALLAGDVAADAREWEADRRG